MKKETKPARKREPLTVKALFKRNPVPFGDVRKYYYAACIGTVVLLALCFHVSVAAIALRTDTCVQIPNGIIAVLLICAILSIVGQQTLTIAGYALSAVCCLALVLVLQLYNGGLMLQSDLPEYGEVFRDGAKSTDFWILLAKVFAVVHMLLSIVFINSTLTVKEEPPLKGMNIRIQQFKDWLDRNNNSMTPGRRATDYWFVAISLVLWMIPVAYEPLMATDDYILLALRVAGCVLVFLKWGAAGGMLVGLSSLISCTQYQFRFGIHRPTVAAYLGLWLAILYIFWEIYLERKRTVAEESVRKRPERLALLWITALLLVAVTPVHEFLGSYSGGSLNYQKDNLPFLFFMPVLTFAGIYSSKWYGYLYGSVCLFWMRHVMVNAAPGDSRLLVFDNVSEHGAIGARTTSRLMSFVTGIGYALAVLSAVLLISAILLSVFGLKSYRKGGLRHGNKEDKEVD